MSVITMYYVYINFALCMYVCMYMSGDSQFFSPGLVPLVEYIPVNLVVVGVCESGGPFACDGLLRAESDDVRTPRSIG